MSEPQAPYKTTPEKYYFDIISTETRTVIKSKKGYLQFYSDHIKYFYEYTVNEKDNEEGIPGIYEYYTISIFNKGLFQTLRVFFEAKAKCWCVEANLEADGFSIFFDEYDKAKELFDKIYKYLYPET